MSEQEGFPNQKSDVERAWSEIKEKVGSTPSVVFSIIGDSDSSRHKPWAKSVFQTALIEAAKSAGDAWILYRGYDYGVSSILQTAYRIYEDTEFRNILDVPVDKPERHVKLISIAGKTTCNIFQINEMDIIDEEDVEKIVASPTEVVCSVIPADKASFLLDFEEYVSKQGVQFRSPTIDIRIPIQIVVLACEGDMHTIEHIAGALKRKIPVIIVKGSGKASDLILDYMENKEHLRKKAFVLFGLQFNEDFYQRLEMHLEYIEKASDLVGVFEVTSEDPLMLSNAVGEMLVTSFAWKKMQGNINTEPSLKGESNGHKNQVSSPKSRGCVLDRQYSPSSSTLFFHFEYQLLQELGKLKKHGDMLVLDALIANRCDYIRVLLDQGVRVRSLSELYVQAVSCKYCDFNEDACRHTQWLLKQIEERNAEKLFGSQRRIMQKIQEMETKIDNLERTLKEHPNLKDNYRKQREKEKATAKLKQLKYNYQNMDEDTIRQKMVAENAKALFRKILGYEEYDEFEDMEREEDSGNTNASDILLWAIFANRMEIAEMFWLRTTNQLLKGLLCSVVLRELAKMANNVKEHSLSADFSDHAKVFEDRCLALMDGMYKEDNMNAIALMNDETMNWGIKSNPLVFAHENYMYDVVAHISSHLSMHMKWYNKIAPDFKTFMKGMCRKKFLTAPLTKYFFNYIMFLIMLVMYSHFVLTGIGEEHTSIDVNVVFEYYVYLWGAGDLIEELLSCFGCLNSEGRSHRGYIFRIKWYLYDFWNVLDILSYALLFAALLLRHCLPNTDLTVARRMYSFSLLVMYMRFLEVFLVLRKMGPTLIMIKEMLKDLLFFLVLAMFVVLGVGIYYHANLWPDHPTIWSGNWVNWRIWKIIYYPYWQLYGETNNDFLEGDDMSACTKNASVWKTNSTLDRCPEEDWTVSAVAAMYMLFSNLLLVNLVIATFSYTFQRVQENAEKLWRFHRCSVIFNYQRRIPSPINLVFLPFRSYKCSRHINRCKNKIGVKRILRVENKRKIYRVHLQRKIANKIFN